LLRGRVDAAIGGLLGPDERRRPARPVSLPCGYRCGRTPAPRARGAYAAAGDARGQRFGDRYESFPVLASGGSRRPVSRHPAERTAYGQRRTRTLGTPERIATSWR